MNRPDARRSKEGRLPASAGGSQASRQKQGAPSASGTSPAAGQRAVTTVLPVTVSRAAAGSGVLSPREQRHPKRTVWRWVFRISLAVLVVSLVLLGVIGVSYWQGANKYEGVAKEALPVQDTALVSPLETVVDWESLWAVNPETIAWVYIPGTEVNYPIVHTSDNDKYIKTDFQGETNWVVSYGAIFLDYACEADLSCQNNFFFGHNMNNGAMFNALASFGSNEVFNKHRAVYLYTPQGNYELRSFAFLHVAADDGLVQPQTGDAADQSAYVQQQMDRSVAIPEGSLPSASEISKTFVFITCDNLASDGRYALYCYVSDSTVEGVEGIS